MSKIFPDSDFSKFRDFSACWFCFLLFTSKLSMTNPSLSKRVKNFQFQSKYHATRKNPIWKRFWITHFSTIITIQVDGKNIPKIFLVKSKLSTENYERTVVFLRTFYREIKLSTSKIRDNRCVLTNFVVKLKLSTSKFGRIVVFSRILIFVRKLKNF